MSKPQQPDAEIRAADFIQEADRNVDPTLDEGRVPVLEGDGKLSVEFIRKDDLNSKAYGVSESIDGSTTPQAVCVNVDGKVQLANANLSPLDKFVGFCTQNIIVQETVFVNASQQTSLGTFSFTANAGTNRVVIVHIAVNSSFGTPTNPSGVTYDGVAMTQIGSVARVRSASTTWFKVIGSNESNDSPVNIVQTGAAGNQTVVIQAACYQHVDQSAPIGQSATGNGDSTSLAATLDPDSAISLIVNTASHLGGFSSWNDSQTNRIATDFTGRLSDVENRTGNSNVYNMTITSDQNWTFQAFELKRSEDSIVAQIRVEGRVGFSGLTPNSKYYLSNTTGQISTTPGSTSVLLGKSLSDDDLIIIQD